MSKYTLLKQHIVRAILIFCVCQSEASCSQLIQGQALHANSSTARDLVVTAINADTCWAKEMTTGNWHLASFNDHSTYRFTPHISLNGVNRQLSQMLKEMEIETVPASDYEVYFFCGNQSHMVLSFTDQSALPMCLWADFKREQVDIISIYSNELGQPGRGCGGNVTGELIALVDGGIDPGRVVSRLYSFHNHIVEKVKVTPTAGSFILKIELKKPYFFKEQDALDTIEADASLQLLIRNLELNPVLRLTGEFIKVGSGHYLGYN